MDAKLAHQTLRRRSQYGTGNQIGLDSHVDQTCEGPGRIIRVQGRNNQMPCEGRFDRVSGCDLVTNFPQQNNVWIMSQDASQAACKRQSGRFIDLNLVNYRQGIFDRIFDRNNFSLRLHRPQFGQNVIQGRRFSATGRACDQKDSVGLRNHMPPLIDL